MLKYYNCIVVILATCFILHTQGFRAISQRNEEKLKGHPNQCYYEAIGYFNYGDKMKHPTECVMLSCNENGDVTIFGCGAVKVEMPCAVEKGELSKSFPDCCYKIKCPENYEV